MSSFGSFVLFEKNQKLIQNKKAARYRSNIKHILKKGKIKFPNDQKIILEEQDGEVLNKKNTNFLSKHFVALEKGFFVKILNKDNCDSIVVGDAENKKYEVCQWNLTRKLNSIDRKLSGVDFKKNIITYHLGNHVEWNLEKLAKENISICMSSNSFLLMSLILMKMKNGKIEKEKCTDSNC